MKQVSREMAYYLFNSNKEVFRLYNDGTEAVIEDIYQLNLHEGIFGVEK